MNPRLSIAYFITSHGFGHASRASAVMNAVYDRWPFVHFEIYTLTPEWFFKNSLKAPFAYHAEQTDVGLVQISSLHFNLDKTFDALEKFLPFGQNLLDALAEQLHFSDCQWIISDISPLGIAVGEHAGITSVLVENFTWDWIYEAYLPADQRFRKYIDLLSDLYGKAGHRIQAQPVCSHRRAQLCTPPISRKPLTDARIVREKLGINERDQMVLITMGGILETLPFTGQLAGFDEHICFVVPGTASKLPSGGKKHHNIIFLPQNSTFYHPDLVNAADAVVGKVGYSTLAEIYHAGVPYGFITRSDFRESSVFESYIQSNMAGIRIDEKDFISGEWLKQLSGLLALPKPSISEPNGAGSAAEYICNHLACEKQILEVVDKQGCVIGAAPRKCVHGNNQLLHRVVHVLVFDKYHRLLLQKRSLNKRVAPGRWDTSVGGHVDCCEPVEKAMFREMEEELGIRPLAPRFIYQYIHSNDFESELVFTYTCRYDGKITYNHEEIDSVRFWEMKEIIDHLGKGILSDNFEDEFKRYQRWVENNTSANLKKSK